MEARWVQVVFKLSSSWMEGEKKRPLVRLLSGVLAGSGEPRLGGVRCRRNQSFAEPKLLSSRWRNAK